MRAVDTNVVVRFLVGDDPKQTEKARQVIGREPVFVPRTVVLEVEWVLRGVYGMAVERVVPALRALAGLPGVTFEDAAMVAKAMAWAEAGLDFADALHLAAARECEGFVTFDKRFARAGSRVETIQLVEL
ncbi:MAG: type II toxin-antitoxin system VapC family toxin [Janthinobacterium lividum]